MRTATPQLVTFLNSARAGIRFDLWTFLFASGTLVRWTDADVDIPLTDGRVFTRGPVITRDRISWARGIVVDQLRTSLAGPSLVVDGQYLPAYAMAGGMDGASALLERVFLDTSGAVQGWLEWFPGQVADVYPSRMGCEVVVKSQLTQLSQQLPRNLYQAACLNNLYDSNCAVARASYTTTGTVTAVGTGFNPAITVSLGASATARMYELGPLKFTSGANQGLGRTVQSQPGAGTSVGIQFARPFPFTIAPGDTFTVAAGCDKTAATCQAKFNNLLRFRGQPYIPVPETVT